MRLSCRLLFWVGLLCASGAVHADDVPTVSYPALVLDDVKHVLTAPARWQEAEWQNLGLAAIGVVGVAAIADRPIRDEMRRHAPNNNGFMLGVERFGAEYSLAVLGGFYLGGVLARDDRSVAVAQDGLAASLIASGIVTPSIKFIAGRGRPREDVGTANFRPFDGSYSLNSSFPSGHTTQAFAVAAVIANHYEAAWVSCTSYSVAGLVGAARSYHDAHFASDVLAGALIGTLVGKSVVAHNQQMRHPKALWLPEISPGLLGVRIVSVF